MVSADVVVVGAGHAGSAVAAELRSAGFAGSLVLLGDEGVEPYHRPPLSKAWLKGTADLGSIGLRPAGFYAREGIDFRPGTRVAELDRVAGRVVGEDGTALSYGRLVLATGARARRLPLPGAELDGVLELRGVADADRLRERVGPGRRLVIVGAGYVGLEVAASASALGARVVVVEQQDTVLARVAGTVLAGFVERFHRERGVTVVTGAQVCGFVGDGAGRVAGVRLADGRSFACDVVLVAVGAVPNDELARTAGLECRQGVVVDEDAVTSDPRILAVGDVTWRPVPLYGSSVRLESVPNALEQARRAAAAICEVPQREHETPWFWSDQYDLKLQIAGLTIGADSTVVRGSAKAAPFAVFHLRGNRVQAVEAVNAPREFTVGRRLIAARTPVSRDRLADPAVPVQEAALS